jgi:hypothetical protein
MEFAPGGMGPPGVVAGPRPPPVTQDQAERGRSDQGGGGRRAERDAHRGPADADVQPGGARHQPVQGQRDQSGRGHGYHGGGRGAGPAAGGARVSGQ